MNFRYSKTGNHMTEDGATDRLIHPDDYTVCDECRELLHIDDVITTYNANNIEKKIEVCERCYKQMPHEFSCKNSNCDCDTFVHDGVAIECPHCHSFEIEGNYHEEDKLIAEARKQYERKEFDAPAWRMQ